MGADEALGGREAEAGAVALGGEERLEEVRPRLGRDARPAVLDRDGGQRRARRSRRGDRHADLARLGPAGARGARPEGHRLDPVHHQIHEHALDPLLVALGPEGRFARGVDAQRHLGRLGGLGAEGQGAVSEGVQVHAPPHDPRAAGEDEQLVGQRPQPGHLLADLRVNAAERVGLASLRGDQVDPHADGAERVLQLVGDDRCRLPHRREPLLRQQGSLRLLELGGAAADPLLERGGQLADPLEILPVLRVALREPVAKLGEGPRQLAELVAALRGWNLVGRGLGRERSARSRRGRGRERGGARRHTSRGARGAELADLVHQRVDRPREEARGHQPERHRAQPAKREQEREETKEALLAVVERRVAPAEDEAPVGLRDRRMRIQVALAAVVILERGRG